MKCLQRNRRRRQTDRQTDRKTDRQTDRQTESNRETDRQTDRQTESRSLVLCSRPKGAQDYQIGSEVLAAEQAVPTDS
jgi:hypothetical protein